MIKTSTTDKIRQIVPKERLFEDEPMSRHTSFRIGGPAALLVQIDNEEELAGVLRALQSENEDFLIVGNGSNLLVSDEGYPGAVLKLGGTFDNIKAAEPEEQAGDKEEASGRAASMSGETLVQGKALVRVGAARLMSSVSAFLTERGLSGFEFASGIPGSIGGAVYMNAGAYGREIKDIAESVRIMDTASLKICDVPAEEMRFGYRTSMVQSGGMIILSLDLRLDRDEPESISARVIDLAERRNSKQPVNYPSAGSTFKRPKTGYAAALIEEAGLKGYRVGGACVSEKHAGFVINDGGASCEDVLSVMRHVRERVHANSGVMLEPEVRLINCAL